MSHRKPRMTFDEARDWLSGLKRYGIKLGLDRFEELLRLAGNPHAGLKAAHIAGTNGKGSTATMIACALQAAGHKAGLYLSPYVFDLRERIQINGQMIGRSNFARLASDARALVEEVEHTEHGQATEFEVKTLIGFLHFAEQNVGAASIEVGLGGRLDATNVILPLISVITNIHYDHMDRLGDTLAKIAFEKAGIIKPGVPVVTGATEPEALQVIRSRALDLDAPLIEAAPALSGSTVTYAPCPGDPSAFSVTTPTAAYERLQPRLQGAFQAANAACAVAALEKLSEAGLPTQPEHVRKGIEMAWLPGRLQLISTNPVLIADGAHNPAGAAEVARYLSTCFPGRRTVLVVGMMESHEPDEVLAHLGPLAWAVIATEPPGPGQHPATAIAACARQYAQHVAVEPDAASAVEVARAEAGPEGVVCVTGSFYLVGALAPLLPPEPA